MSLDVYLVAKEPVVTKGTGIFVREGGKTKELTLDEAKERYPNHEVSEFEREELYAYQANITGNLGRMADQVKIGERTLYDYLWGLDDIRPKIKTAKRLVTPLQKGLNELIKNPEKYEPFNPDNGWGSYDGLCDFVYNYLKACVKNPDCKIEVCR